MFCNVISDKCAEPDTPPPSQDMCPHFCQGGGGTQYFVSVYYKKVSLKSCIKQAKYFTIITWFIQHSYNLGKDSWLS